MSCNKCNKLKCGCGDVPVNMPNSYSNDPTVCPPNSEPCSEVFDMACICYNGPDIVELDIKQGTRLDEILQKLVLATLNPGCANFFDPALSQSPINLTVTNITSSSFVLSWDTVAAATGYRVEFKEASSTAWLLSPIITAPTILGTIIGLVPDTVYDVRVVALTPVGDCVSLNIRIKTTL